MKKIVMASSNRGKIEEIQAQLQDKTILFLPQSEFNVPDAEETGLSFVENAIIKARNACLATGLPAVGDDSGIEVDALNGAPGIYTARYARKGATDSENIQKLLSEMRDVPLEKRSARFQCVMTFLRHANDPSPVICQGTWEGAVLEAPRGKMGHGYDPIFYVPTHGCAAAELPLHEKIKISHRSHALRQLIHALQTVGIKRPMV